MNRENAKHYKVAIIGGGVSGLISTMEIAKAFGGENVVVFEKLNRVGKKILSTGNGSWTDKEITVTLNEEIGLKKCKKIAKSIIEASPVLSV